MKLFVYILLLLVSTFSYIFSDDPLGIANLQFYIYGCIILVDIYYRRSVTLVQVWLVGYLYIINSEILSDPNLFINDNIWAVKFLGISNNLVLLGYFLTKTKVVKKINNVKPKLIINKSAKFVFFLLIFFFLLSYIVITYQQALAARLEGRGSVESTGSFNLFTILISNCRYVLPAIIAYYFSLVNNKRSMLYALVLSSPIFILLFWSGSRFPLLFSVLGFIIAGNIFNIRRLTLRSFIIGIICLFLLNTVASFMKSHRTGGYDKNIEQSEQVEYQLLSQRLSNDFSPEGVVKMTNFSHRYFSRHDHLYGVSTGFLTYFWIPRFLWPEKPTMLGYWLIRTDSNNGFSSGHSVSLGFAGDLYADFGLFSWIFVFILGCLIKKMDNFCSRALSSSKYNRILGAMLYPYVFFIVRSPVTGSITMIGILGTYYLFKYAINITQGKKVIS